jgi:uncharacterized protein (TIGR00251 family)
LKVDELNLREFPDGVSIGIRVHPRAGRNKVQGIHDGNLKVSIAAPPVEGEATLQCMKFLAKLFAVSNSSVNLISGAQSRNKVFKINGIGAEECRRMLRQLDEDHS